MSDIRFIIYLFVTLIISLYIVFAKPDMHKQAIITDSAYEFAQIEMPQAEIKPSAPTIDIQNIPMQTKQVKPSVQTVERRPVTIENKNIKTTSVSQKKIVTTQPKQNQTTKKTVNTVSQTQQKPQTQTVQKPVQQTAPSQPVQKPIRVTQENPIHTVNTPLTEQEEIIAWNRWRSRLQNQTMMDTKLAAPLGTQFKFSFTVDKYGNMSNVKVWSTNPAYSDMAVRAIKPVLMSYRNKPILNFPAGTKRIITNVTGGFVISRTTEYSTPADYNDFERVKR